MKRYVVYISTVLMCIIAVACGGKSGIDLPKDKINRLEVNLPVEGFWFSETTDSDEIKVFVNELENIEAHKTDDFFQESPNASIKFFCEGTEEVVEIEFNYHGIEYNIDYNTDIPILLRVSTADRSKEPWEWIGSQYYYVDNWRELEDLLKEYCFTGQAG